MFDAKHSSDRNVDRRLDFPEKYPNKDQLKTWAAPLTS